MVKIPFFLRNSWKILWSVVLAAGCFVIVFISFFLYKTSLLV